MRACLGGCQGPPVPVWPPRRPGSPLGLAPVRGGQQEGAGFLLPGEGAAEGVRCRPPAPGGVRPPAPGQLSRCDVVRDAAVTRCEGSAVPVPRGRQKGVLSGAPPPGCPAKGGSPPGQSRPQPSPGALPMPFQGTGAPCQDNGDARDTERLPQDGRAPGPGSRGTAGRERAAAASPFGSEPSALPSPCSALPCPRLSPHRTAWGEPSRAEPGGTEPSPAEPNPLHRSCQRRPHISPTVPHLPLSPAHHAPSLPSPALGLLPGISAAYSRGQKAPGDAWEESRVEPGGKIST